MIDKIKVGILGCGFVGGALKDWLEHNNPNAQLFISDPPKGYNDDLSQIDVAFIHIHVPTEDDGTQDLTLMNYLKASNLKLGLLCNFAQPSFVHRRIIL